MAEIILSNARVLTLASADDSGPLRGHTIGELGAIDSGEVVVRDGLIASVGPAGHATANSDSPQRIDCAGRVLMPSFIDCHTHACSAGDRLDEWERKQQGATYLEILESGGGIMSTVRAVRQASEAQLVESLSHRLEWMLREGTTTVEIKSGYGLSTADELKMLRAITKASETWAGTLVPTACIGHAKDPDCENFVRQTIDETLVAVHDEFPGITIDAYCEQGAWSLDECVQLFERAQELGHPIRIHTDQFNSLGMTRWAIDHGAKSVDHLEATVDADIAPLAKSDTFGVALPCSGFHVDGRYADGKALLDAGCLLAIASNCNPGSAPSASMPMAIALGVRNLGISAAEAIGACTRNAAHLLALPDRGSIVPGNRADLILLRYQDERQLGYEFGGSPVDLVLCKGQIAFDVRSATPTPDKA